MTALSMPFQSRIPFRDLRSAGTAGGTLTCRFLLMCLFMTLGALSWHFVEAGTAFAVPLPAGYVQCATENGTNNCPSGTIAYTARRMNLS